MKKISDLYTTITAIECSVIFVSLSISSFGVIIDETYLAYFWYLAVTGMIMMLLTSFLLGVALIFACLVKRLLPQVGSKGDHGLLPRPKCVRI